MIKNIKSYLNAPLILCILFSVASAFIYIHENQKTKAHVAFLPIGQGAGIHMRSDNGHNAVFDTGPYSNIADALNKSLPVWEQDIHDVYISHPDRDHIEWLIYLLTHYNVQNIHLTGVLSKSKIYKAVLTKLTNIPKSKRPTIILSTRDDNKHYGTGVFVQTLYPTTKNTYAKKRVSDVNQSSSIHKLTFYGTDILITGDTNPETILQIKNNIDVDILQIPHHGSKNNINRQMLSKTNPCLAIIQAGKDNPYHHPHKETIELLYDEGIAHMSTQSGILTIGKKAHSWYNTICP